MIENPLSRQYVAVNNEYGIKPEKSLPLRKAHPVVNMRIF
jgi:hypothetical protein